MAVEFPRAQSASLRPTMAHPPWSSPKMQQFWSCYRGISTSTQKPKTMKHRHHKLLLRLPSLLPPSRKLLSSCVEHFFTRVGHFWGRNYILSVVPYGRIQLVKIASEKTIFGHTLKISSLTTAIISEILAVHIDRVRYGPSSNRSGGTGGGTSGIGIIPPPPWLVLLVFIGWYCLVFIGWYWLVFWLVLL